MRKLLIILLLSVASLAAAAQAQITTKREKISDFPIRTTKIVLTGRDFFDAALRDAARTTWNVSPFEICDTSEFSSLRKRDDLYFLVTTRNDDEPGILFLSLMKGGQEKVEDMVEAVRIPVCSDSDMSGRVTVYMPALLVTVQNYMTRALSSGFSGIGKIVEKLSKVSDYQVVFDPSDISDTASGAYYNPKAYSSDEADAMMQEAEPRTLTSYVVRGKKNCYTMLFDTGTLALYWYGKNRSGGFTASDVRRIAYSRK